MSQFTKIFSLQVHHNYFEDDALYPIGFKLTKESQRLTKRFGMKMVALKNGLELFCYNTKTTADYLKYIETVTGETSLSILLSSSDENFCVYTDLALDFLGRYEYDSTDHIEIHNNSYVLHKQKTEEGEYSEFAKVEVLFKDLIIPVEAPNYVISLEARKTRWNYFIINKSGLDLKDSVIVGKSEVQFEGPSNVNLPNGQKALLFSSGNTLLKLTELAKHQFSLVNYQKGKSKLNNSRLLKKNVFKGLPIPNPGLIEVNLENETKVVSSPMYVYI